VGTTEHYDGTNWTSGGGLNTARFYLAGFGTLTSAVAAGGNGGESAVEEYNGSSWTTVNSLNTGRTQLGSSGSSETDGIVFGGEAPGPTVKADAESYNGTSWTEGPNLGTARRGLSGSSGHSASAALATAGYPTYNLTEEFNKSANTITAAAFASSGAVPLANQDLAGFGIQTAAIGAGGYSGPYTNASYSYNGTSWTNTPSLNTARTCKGAGSQTAGVVFGGNAPPSDAYQNATEEWNGSSWTSVNNMASAVSGDMAIGVAQTAVISVGGQSPAYPARQKQQEYDGTNWTTSSATLNNGRRNGSAHGTVTAGLVAFGESPGPENVQNYAESYNGSSWTNVSTANTARKGVKGFGTQTNAVAAGGSSIGPVGITYSQSERYNGTGWATAPSLATARYNMASAGVGASTNSGLIFNGAPGYSTATEEFTDETETANITDFTTS